MNSLELKVLPPIQFITTAILMWLTSLYLPSLQPPNQLFLPISILFVTISGGFACLAIQQLKQSKTTINPTTPHETTTLITDGIYKITRNPMYVCLLMLLIAWAIYLANIPSFSFIIGFVLYMTRFQILPEERLLSSKFPAAFLVYQKRVPRWL